MASILVSSEGVEQKYPLDNPSVTLGRGLESDIRLKDIKASRRHCQIVKTPKGFQCVDLSSGNGTFLNGVQIKQQMLNPGDKIQIGATTITFEEEAAAKPAAKAKSGSATAVLPKVQAPAPKAGPGAKVPTGQIPVAQTRRITARIETVKPSTQSIPKAASSASMKKVSQRGGSTGRSPRGQTAGAAPKAGAEGRPKKTSPVAVLLGVIGAAFAIVVAVIIFWPKDNSELTKSRIDAFTKEAGKFESQDKPEAAIGEYRKALELCTSDRYKNQAADIKAQIKSLQKAIDAPAPRK